MLGDIAAIVDGKTAKVLPQLGSVALAVGEPRRGDDQPQARGEGHEAVRVSRQGDDGHDRTRGGGRADDEGTHDDRAQGSGRGWSGVHLALLPTNEDRAKAIVDWVGTALTHQRVGRITVNDE